MHPDLLLYSWWGRMDLNHRRLRQRIYSPFPLATRVLPRSMAPWLIVKAPLQIIVNGEDFVQTGDGEYLQDIAFIANEPDTSAFHAGLLKGGYEHPEPGRIHELESVQVDDHVLLPRFDDAIDRLLEHRRGREVYLPLQHYYRGTAFILDVGVQNDSP